MIDMKFECDVCKCTEYEIGIHRLVCSNCGYEEWIDNVQVKNDGEKEEWFGVVKTVDELIEILSKHKGKQLMIRDMKKEKMGYLFETEEDDLCFLVKSIKGL